MTHAPGASSLDRRPVRCIPRSRLRALPLTEDVFVAVFTLHAALFAIRSAPVQPQVARNVALLGPARSPPRRGRSHVAPTLCRESLGVLAWDSLRCPRNATHP